MKGEDGCGRMEDGEGNWVEGSSVRGKGDVRAKRGEKIPAGSCILHKLIVSFVKSGGVWSKPLLGYQVLGNWEGGGNKEQVKCVASDADRSEIILGF